MQAKHAEIRGAQAAVLAIAALTACGQVLARGTSAALAIGLLATLFGSASGEEMSAPEYKIKAAYLYHFTKFSKWPDGTFARPDEPFVVCLYGKDPFGSILEQTVAGKSVQERPLVVRRPEGLQELGSCHVVFISASEHKRLAQILAGLGGSAVLTVGEAPDFLEQGGAINFYIQDNKVQFEIDPAKAELAHIKISSQLLKLVKSGKGREKEG